MTVYVTLRVAADPAAFEKAAAEHADAIGRIMGVARSNGLIGHRWFRGEAEVMAVDEWPDAESFQAFFAGAESEIGPFMAAAGVTSPPEVTVWGHVAIDDVVGWGA
jgi:heme-degrading monooxygenase HmoA